MKRAVIIILSLLLILTVSSGVAWAKPDKAKGGGSSKSKHVAGPPSASSDESAGEDGEYEVEVKDGKIEVKGNGTSFEFKDGKLEFKSEKGKVEISENNMEFTGNGLQEFQKKAQAYKELVSQGEEVGQTFSDVNNHWGAKVIEKLSAIGLVGGYEDGTFQPNKPVTMAETIALLMRVAPDEELEDPVDGEEESASDVEVQNEDAAEAGDDNAENQDETGEEQEEVQEEIPGWAMGAVEKASQKGILNMNRFHSHVQAERAQVAVWVAKTMGLEPVDSEELPFTDSNLLSTEDAGYLMALYNEGIISGTPGGSFNPNSAITRAELAAIMERLLAQEEAVEGESEEDTTGEESTVEDSEETTEDPDSDNVEGETSA